MLGIRFGLLERTFHHDPPTARDLHHAEAVIDEQLVNMKRTFPPSTDIPLVGTAGTVILRRIMETFMFNTCLVSDYGLREGILVDKAEKLQKTREN